jgi:DNA-binding transcriptional LysR family regulator
MQDLNDLYYFAQVVEHGGFAAASRVINVPKSKLSRRIAYLEERLGVRLLQRSSRQFSVTEVGQKYYQHCQAMLINAIAAQELIESSHIEPQGTIRISCPPALLYYQIGDMLSRFMLRCPKIQVQMEVTNRNVDVMAEGIDIALRVRFPPLVDSDLVMKTFAISPQCLVAHPRLIEQVGMPSTPEDLQQFKTLGLGNAEQQHIWALHHAQGETVRFAHQPCLIVNDIIGVTHAALQGVGVAPLPRMIAQQYLLQKQLIEILPEWKPTSGIVHAAFASRRGLLPAVRQLLDFFTEEFQSLIEDDMGYE